MSVCADAMQQRSGQVVNSEQAKPAEAHATSNSNSSGSSSNSVCSGGDDDGGGETMSTTKRGGSDYESESRRLQGMDRVQERRRR